MSAVLERFRKPTTPPLLSVIVPVYRVEPYVERCIESIRAQPLRDIEVVLVDDGSPDRSIELARRAVGRDRRFRIVAQDNRGLGAARNRGLPECNGRYLAFVDSDDILPEDAWGEAIRTLESTGSDVAVGALRMLTPEGPRMTARMRENHQVQKLGIEIGSQPSLLADVFAHNKVYRRSFWDEHAFAFPEGVRYEDQPLLTDLLLAASAIDVLTTVTYHWHIRADGSSLTQGRGRLDDLSDRILTKRWSLRSVEESGDTALRDTFLADVLPVDMFQYFRCVPGSDDAYWQLLREGMQELWGNGPVPFEQTWVPVQQRLMGWFVLQDRRADLERLISFIDANGGPVLEEVDDHREFAHPWRGESGLPSGVTRVSERER